MNDDIRWYNAVLEYISKIRQNIEFMQQKVKPFLQLKKKNLSRLSKHIVVEETHQ